MRHRGNNAQRMFDSYLDGSWYYKKGDSIRLDTSNNYILDGGTPIGRIEDLYEPYTDCYNQYVILTMQTFKSKPMLKKKIKQIALEAIRQGYPVIFVDYIDIGFGEPAQFVETDDKSFEAYYAKLIRLLDIQKFESPYEKNAMMLYTIVEEGELIYNRTFYCMTQERDWEIQTPEQILVNYLSAKYIAGKRYGVISVTEPIGKNLQSLLNLGAKCIAFAKGNKHHSDDTLDYQDLINAGVVTNKLGEKVILSWVPNNKVNKYLDKQKESK